LDHRIQSEEDLAEWERLRNTQAFRAFLANMREEVSARRAELEGDAGPERTANLRGRIAATRAVLTLIESMTEEAVKRLRPGGMPQ
jgi:hypothetical protein